MIYYYKDKLNPADRPSRRPDYMNENKESNIIITKLISILSNKLHLDRLELKELAITLLKINE